MDRARRHMRTSRRLEPDVVRAIARRDKNYSGWVPRDAICLAAPRTGFRLRGSHGPLGRLPGGLHPILKHAGKPFALITSRILITPRYSETNQMGFVSEGSYPRWLDMGRAALLREQGLDYGQFESLGYRMPVLEIGLTFHEPAYYDDALQVITSLRGRPTFRIRLDYEVRRDATLIATGHSIQGFVNRRHRPVKPPEAFMSRLEAVFPKVPHSGSALSQNSTAAP